MRRLLACLAMVGMCALAAASGNYGIYCSYDFGTLTAGTEVAKSALVPAAHTVTCGHVSAFVI